MSPRVALVSLSLVSLLAACPGPAQEDAAGAARDAGARDRALTDTSTLDLEPGDVPGSDAAGADTAPGRDQASSDSADRDAARLDATRNDAAIADASRTDSAAPDRGGADAMQTDTSRPDSGRADASLRDVGIATECPDPEITYTFDPRTDCQATYTGGIIISTDSSDGWSLLEGVDCIEGGLVIENTSRQTISVPDLKYVSSNVLIWQHYAAERIALPALRRVGGELHINSSAATAIALPLLEEVGKLLEIKRHSALTELNLPKLLRVGGVVEIGGIYSDQLPLLARVSLPELRLVEGSRFTIGSQVPVDLFAPRLVRAGPEGIWDGIQLQSEIGDAFTCASGCSGSFDECLARCGRSVTVDLGSLCYTPGFALYFPRHVDLSLDLGSLRATGWLRVETIQFGRFASLDLGQLEQARALRFTSTGFTAIALPALAETGELVHNVKAPHLPFSQGCGEGCTGDLSAPSLRAVPTVELTCAGCAVDLSGVQVIDTLTITGDPDLALAGTPTIANAHLIASGQRAVSAVARATLTRLELESPIEAIIELGGVTSLDALTLSRTSGSTPATLTRFLAPDLVAAGTLYLDLSEVQHVEVPALGSLGRFENNGARSLQSVDLGLVDHIDVFEWRNNYGGADVSFDTITTLGELHVGYSDTVPVLPRLTRAETVYASLFSAVLALPMTSAGALYLTCDNGAWLHAPALATLGELRLSSSDPAGPCDLSSALPALVEISGTLQVDDAFYVTELLLPNLRAVGGSVYVRNDTRLQRLSLPDLASAYGITISNNPALTAVELPQLGEVRWLTVQGNPQLPQCDLIAQARDLFTPPPESGRSCVKDNADDCADDCP